MNHGYTYTSRMGPRDEGLTLLEHLVVRHAHSDEEAWRERIEGGLVRVEGAPASAEQHLTRGQEVAWMRPPWEEPEVPLTYEVLYEDADLVAVAKPSGLPTHPNGGFLEHTLLHLVRQRYPTASPIHRLGRGTSGIVLFSLTTEANRVLCAALREHRITKIYRALVQGHPAQDAFTVDTPIGPVPHPTLGTVHAASPTGRPALSHVTVLQRRPTDALVEVQIETGRPHQIRIHMAAAGHPLVGDPLYAIGGGLQEGTTALPGDLGYLLHAHRIVVAHPGTEEWMELESPLPEKLQLRQV